MSRGTAIGRTPETYPFGFDIGRDRIAFLSLRREQFAEASFLDARVLAPGAERWNAAWPEVAAAISAAGLRERCGYIFHIGHVGSTLLSRLLGAHPRVFALREPLLLRTFAELRSPRAGAGPADGAGGEASARAEPAHEERLSGCLKLLSRTFAPTDLAILKATSFVAEIAAALLERPASPKALLMYVSPQSYLATILGGPNSRQEAKLLLGARVARLRRRAGPEAGPLDADSSSEGEALALTWACETAALAQAARVAGGRALRLDFDGFLAAPEAHLARVLRHFDLAADAAAVSAILAGPDMGRYSKAPEYAYDAALRRDVLAAARLANGAEIRRGLAWLERMAGNYPPVREALAFAVSPLP
jgi:hypothetical protein